MRELASHQLVLVARRGRSPLREEFIAMCHDAGFEPTIGAVLASVEDALAAIGTSDAWSLLTTRSDAELAAAGTEELPLADDRPPARIWAVARTSPAPAARAFLELIRGR